MPNSSFKIVCFGDSTTDDQFVSSDSNYEQDYNDLKTYSDHLKIQLSSLLSKQVEVINSGISGDTTLDAKMRFQKDVLDHHPDLVIIQFGVNDQSIRQDLDLSTSVVSLDEFAYNLLFFLSRIKKINASIILMTPGLLLWTEEFKKKYFKKPYILDDRYGLNGNLLKYTELIRKIAKSENTGLVDIFNAELAYDKEKNQTLTNFLPDGLHPNNLGHSFIANHLLIFLQHFLKKAYNA